MSARGAVAVVVLCAALAACSSSTGSAASSVPPTTVSAGTPTPTTSLTPSGSQTAEPSPVPDLPQGLPASFGRDVASGDVPPASLVPASADVTGTWYASTSAGEAIVVAWQLPGTDPSDPLVPRGVAVWRRFDDGGAPWRPVYGVAYARKAGVFAITSVTGDVTGDGSEDALVFAVTGGSGGCGTYDVIDLASGTRVYDQQVCDTQITPSASPVGLTVIEAVYAPDDPHCCPSATRTTVLAYDGDSNWHVVSRQVIPNG